jgi:polysaccharide biosynthesis PFTS motif protein
LVWDNYQLDFIKRMVGDCSDTEVVGPIWFSSKAVDLESLPDKTVAVFDVQPHRASKYQMLGIATEYFVPKVVNLFLQDIQIVLSELGVAMAHKRKRNIGNLAHPQYQNLIKILSGKANFISIESDTAAINVIQRCQAVISQPFTSTAIQGKMKGLPSIYYDPFNQVQKDDRAAHGIPVVIGLNELRLWATQLFDKTKQVGMAGNEY